MSLMRCEKHDKFWDSDLEDDCVECIEEVDEDEDC